MMPKGPVRYFNLFLLLLCGCSQDAVKPAAALEPVLSHQYRQDSVTVIVSVSETNIATTGQVQLALDVQAPPGTAVVFPEVENAVEPFTLSGSWSEPQQTLPNGKILYRSVWQLVPNLPGETVFQPLEIIAGTATVKTDPITVSVRSVLPEGLDSLEIKDIAAPATVLPEQQQKEHLWFILLGSSIAMATLLALVRRRRNTKAIIVLSPRETAFQALANLPDDPIARIHELDRILREYLELRFGLPMAGKTTEEIIPVIPHYPLLGRRLTLEAFLTTSERVRFSHRMPDGFLEKSERYIRQFIEETKEEENP
ncbi:MAG: BatD family protein [Kiritimatiellales bacterium]|nr:BatD family protein [Kiritimatiellales bacterium]MCF7864757.1 BatD family protein [Kiritimatiellales bacterium]